MKKLLLFILFCVTFILTGCSNKPSEPEPPNSIVGLWKSTDQHSDKPRALVAIYNYQGEYFGRMLATYDDKGRMQDTIKEQKSRAPGVVGNPPYCGMDFIFSVVPDEDGEKYEGNIIDPEEGKIYDAELWRDGADLIVRGKVWIFGKNMTWHPASKQDLPRGFSMNDIKDFVPVIPEPL